MSRAARLAWRLTWSFLLPVLVPVAAVALLLYGVSRLDETARRELGGGQTPRVSFLDISCQPPPGISREHFLGEVQFLAGLPDQLDLLDLELPRRLGEAFALHPWVAEVRRVEVFPQGRIEAELHYRVPTLAVPVAKMVLVVDAEGVLLPPSASAAGLPVFRGEAVPPETPAGKVWEEPQLRAALALLAHLRDFRDRLAITAVEVGKEGLTLVAGEKTRIVWGQAPGAEGETEAPADLKRQRLLEAVDKGKPLGGLDLRKSPAP